MRVYVDTNIIIDHLSGRDFRGSLFFERALLGEYIVIISDWTLKELNKNGLDATNLLRWLDSGKALEIVFSTASTIVNAKDLSTNFDTHYEDALHASIAISAKADCLLTQNIKDFRWLQIAKIYSELGIK